MADEFIWSFGSAPWGDETDGIRSRIMYFDGGDFSVGLEGRFPESGTV